MISADPDRTHWPGFVEDGIEARKQLEGAQWCLGDLAREIETTYGKADLQAYADAIGVEYHTLLNYRHVSKRFESSRRRENLTWSHHERLAIAIFTHARGEVDEWLARAETEGWSVRKLARMVEADTARKKWEAQQRRSEDGPAGSSTSSFHTSSDSSAWSRDLREAARFCEVLGQLASRSLSPQEVANLVPVEEAAAVDQYLADACDWLMAFADAWHGRWAEFGLASNRGNLVESRRSIHP
jgi:hypothetical protein